MTTILIVDDVAPMAEQYAYDLNRLGGFDVIQTAAALLVGYGGALQVAKSAPA